MVNVNFSPSYMNIDLSFKYENGEFDPMTIYHPPILNKTGDGLYYKHRLAQAAIWNEYFVNKIP